MNYWRQYLDEVGDMHGVEDKLMRDMLYNTPSEYDEEYALDKLREHVHSSCPYCDGRGCDRCLT